MARLASTAAAETALMKALYDEHAGFCGAMRFG